MRYVTAASPEHYAEVLATAQSSPRLPWTDTTTPRTDSPVRFAWNFDAHNGGKVPAWTEPYSWEV